VLAIIQILLVTEKAIQSHQCYPGLLVIKVAAMCLLLEILNPLVDLFFVALRFLSPDTLIPSSLTAFPGPWK
jgi:hypothetical protein